MLLWNVSSEILQILLLHASLIYTTNQKSSGKRSNWKVISAAFSDPDFLFSVNICSLYKLQIFFFCEIEDNLVYQTLYCKYYTELGKTLAIDSICKAFFCVITLVNLGIIHISCHQNIAILDPPHYVICPTPP